MKIIKDTTPAADGFRMPAEFEPHEGCIMIFRSVRIPGTMEDMPPERLLRRLPRPLRSRSR